jgi:hypothetical protein
MYRAQYTMKAAAGGGGRKKGVCVCVCEERNLHGKYFDLIIELLSKNTLF